MTVFKTFLKVLNKLKFVVIMYTVILLVFGVFNMQAGDSTSEFTASRPDILIVNGDKGSVLTENLVRYMEDNCESIDVKNDEEAVDDALFYRDADYVIYIPENYGKNVLDGQNPRIEVKSTQSAGASFAEMLLSRYIKIQNIYADEMRDEDEIINKINLSLESNVKAELTSQLDSGGLSRATLYYNFASYSLLAGAIYVICLILSSFNEEKIKKRITVSSMNYKKHNSILMLSNGLFAVSLWLFYVLLSFIFIGKIMFSFQGLIYIINSFLFAICALTIAFFIGSLVNNKNAVNGIVNVFALGSSFLCGAFVPIEWLPQSIVNAAHVLPAYWYIQNNELTKTIEVFDFNTLKPILVNMGVLVLFCAAFILFSNICARRKRKIA